MALSYGDVFYSGTALAFGDAEFSVPDNAAPVFTSVDILSLDQNSTINHTLLATDADGDTVNYSLLNNTISWVSIAGAVITITPDLSITAGDYVITAQAEDGNYLVQQQITITVTQAATIIIAPIKRQTVWDEGQTPDIVLGDTMIHCLTLNAGVPSAAFDVSQATTIKAAFITKDHRKRLSSVVELNSDDIGADWSNGMVSITMGETATQEASGIIDRATLAKLEIEVVLVGNSFTWFAPVNLLPGLID